MIRSTKPQQSKRRKRARGVPLQPAKQSADVLASRVDLERAVRVLENAFALAFTGAERAATGRLVYAVQACDLIIHVQSILRKALGLEDTKLAMGGES